MKKFWPKKIFLSSFLNLPLQKFRIVNLQAVFKKRSFLKKIDFYLFWLIFLLAFFLRFVKASQLFPFTMDEEYQAFLVKEIIEGRHFPLIGVNVADTGLYLGPFFTYLSALVYFIGRQNLLIWAFLSALFGALTSGLIIKIGQKFDRWAGLLAGLFYAVSFLANAWDRKFWNPSLVPFLISLWLWTLPKINKNPRWWLMIAAIFGLAFHTHYSLLVLIPATLIYLKKFAIRFKFDIWLKSLVVFGLFLLPIAVFDLRHGFVNVKALLNLFKFSKNWDLNLLISKIQLLAGFLARSIYVPGNHDLAKEISLCADMTKSSPFWLVGLLVLISWLVLNIIFKRKLAKKYLFLLNWTFLFFVFLWFLYPKNVAEYYLLPLLPLIYLCLALVAEFLIKARRWFFWPIAVFVAIFVTYNTLSVLDMKHSFGLSQKRQLINWVGSHLGKESYGLEAIGNCYKFEGYRFLFAKYYKAPVVSYMDNSFSWLYPELEKEEGLYSNLVVIANNKGDFGDQEFKDRQKFIFGNYGLKKIVKFNDSEVIILSRPR